MVDIHQIRFISLLPTPYDHFQFVRMIRFFVISQFGVQILDKYISQFGKILQLLLMFSQINRPDSCTCTIFSVTYLRQPCYCYTWYRYTNIKGEDNCTAPCTIITVTFIFTSLISVTNHKEKIN